MFISKISLNLKNSRVQKELSNPYEMHRTLMTAFPDKVDGGAGKVLFRVEGPKETDGLGIVCDVLIQSEKPPEWKFLSATEGFIACKPQTKDYNPDIKKGQELYFKLYANPTKKDKKTGKRLGLLREEDQLNWLKRKSESGGFKLLHVRIIPKGLQQSTKKDLKVTFLGTQFEGILKVDDSKKFLETLQSGVGSAKGFGYGMLSVAAMIY